MARLTTTSLRSHRPVRGHRPIRHLALVGWLTLGLLSLCGMVLVSSALLAVPAQADSYRSPVAEADMPAASPVKAHSNEGFVGAKAEPFSINCQQCHDEHQTPAPKLLRAEGASVCANCHEGIEASHDDPELQREAAWSEGLAGCLTCHPHSAGFMPAKGPLALTLTKQALGYDDLDADGRLSPGDRVHYRLDYANPGLDMASAVVLRDEPEPTYVAAVEAASDGGVVDGLTVTWELGTLSPGAAGHVTYDLLLLPGPAAGTDTTTSTTAAPQTDDAITTTPATESGPPATDSTTGSDSTTSSDSTVAESSTTVPGPDAGGVTTTGSATTSTTVDAGGVGTTATSLPTAAAALLGVVGPLGGGFLGRWGRRRRHGRGRCRR